MNQNIVSENDIAPQLQDQCQLQTLNMKDKKKRITKDKTRMKLLKPSHDLGRRAPRHDGGDLCPSLSLSNQKEVSMSDEEELQGLLL